MPASDNEGTSELFGRTRYFILAISVFCLSIIFSNSLAFNFTVLCMDDVYSYENQTGVFTNDSHWLHSPTHVNWLFSAIAIGCLIGTLPVSALIRKFGMGFTITVYGLLSGVATVLFPYAVSISYPAVFFLRIIQGIPTGLSFPATGMIASQWSTDKGSGSFIAILSCHIQFCSIITSPIAGSMCSSSLGWRSLYYGQGFVTIAAYLFFYYFYRDAPGVHKCVSTHELKKIDRGKENQGGPQVPYRRILSDKCILAIWLSAFGATMGFQVFFMYAPIYLNKVIGVDIRATGFLTALPPVLSAALKFVLRPVSDKASCIPQKWRLIMFAALSQGMMATCYFGMALTSDSTVAQVLYVLSIVFSGVNAVGTIKCSQMVSRQHVHFVMSVISLILCIVVWVVPILVDLICPNHTPEEWSRLFWIVGFVIVFTNLPFVFFAQDKPADWTMDTNKVSPIPSMEKTIVELEDSVESKTHIVDPQQKSEVKFT